MTRLSLRTGPAGPLWVVALLNALGAAGLWDLHDLGKTGIGLGLLAYFFGLRHAFDLDHITAIDTVTRALREKQRAASSVGLYFSLGHSSVVIVLSLFVATIVRATSDTMAGLSHTGAILGLAVSAAFLLAMGVANFSLFLRLVQVRRAGAPGGADDSLVGGLLARLFKGVFRLVHRDWHMYFVGFLFGLGFDTATEVAVLGLSAATARDGAVSLAQIMAFPLLFTAGMSLFDTLDGMAVARMYDWALRDPQRRRRLNMVVTGAGVLVAFLVSASEWGQLWAATRGAVAAWQGPGGIGFSTAGALFTAALATLWLAGWLWHRRDAAPQAAVAAGEAAGAAADDAKIPPGVR